MAANIATFQRLVQSPSGLGEFTWLGGVLVQIAIIQVVNRKKRPDYSVRLGIAIGLLMAMITVYWPYH
ncbi:MAG: hypothetical protein QNJ14_14020 [Woeseiaceae bacterium]|nr:hypothetical protein [Woeseiaceae bacterium]